MPAVIVMPHDAPAAKVAATTRLRRRGRRLRPLPRGSRGDRQKPRASERGMTLIPPYDHPGRHRRPGHRGQGADRGGRRARRAVRLPRRRRPARRLGARGARAGAARARSTASSPRPATTASSRFARGAHRDHRDAAHDRRRRADAASRRAHVPDHPPRASPTSSPRATPSSSRRCASSPSGMKMIVEPTGCARLRGARDGSARRARRQARRHPDQRRQRRPGAVRGARRSRAAVSALALRAE